ncbi:hypothetical protein HPULCUR_008760 [Helicostylum pulchrum]|uniref:Uncharacterized protein n=1 Tax=Helicostylum pulchrum TaxID=562976 RepID=A0ABP9Y8I9_9FUNG
MFRLHRRTTSGTSDTSNWSCDSNSPEGVLPSILSNGSSQVNKSTVKFSKVLIVNDTTTAYITKESSLPGSAKRVIDRYYSN